LNTLKDYNIIVLTNKCYYVMVCPHLMITKCYSNVKLKAFTFGVKCTIKSRTLNLICHMNVKYNI